MRGAARLFATGGNAAIYYGLGVTEHSQGSTMVMAMANLAMVTGNIGHEGVGVNPLRGQNNVQGSCDMGSFPHEFPGYRHVSNEATRKLFEKEWKVELSGEPGLRIPNMFDEAAGGTFKGLFVHGEDIAQSDPNTNHVAHALESLEILVVQDLFLNETAAFAHVFFPGTSFLEKDGTFTNAERRVNRVRPVMREEAGHGRVGDRLPPGHRHGLSDDVHVGRRDHGRDRPPDADLQEHLVQAAGRARQRPVAVRRRGAGRHPDHAHRGVHARQGPLHAHRVRGRRTERSNRKFPLILTTGRILSQYNVGAQTRRTENNVWYTEDILEMHPSDAEVRGIKDGTLASLTSRVGGTTMRVKVTDRVPPGVVYSTFHFPVERRQRHHHRELGLGDQLPRVQGDGGAGDAFQPAFRMAGRVGRARAREQAYRRQDAGRGGVMAGARAFKLCRSRAP